MLHGVTEGHAIQKDVPRWKYIRQLCLFLGMGLFPVLHSHWILCLHLIWTSGCKMQKKPWACFLLPVNGNLAFKKALIAFLFKFRSSTALAICFVLAWVSLTKSSHSTRLQPPGTSPLDVTSGPIHQILRGKKKTTHFLYPPSKIIINQLHQHLSSHHIGAWESSDSPRPSDYQNQVISLPCTSGNSSWLFPGAVSCLTWSSYSHVL